MGCFSYRNANRAMPAIIQSNTASAEAVACPGLGVPAPEFTAMTTQGIKSLSDYRGKWLIFFSHPGDFTPV